MYMSLRRSEDAQGSVRGELEVARNEKVSRIKHIYLNIPAVRPLSYQSKTLPAEGNSPRQTAEDGKLNVRSAGLELLRKEERAR